MITMNKKRVLAFGTFDILHLGHLRYLEKAKSLGDELVVVVSRDESVKLIKNRKPIFGERDRVKLVGMLKQVDKAVLGNRIRKFGDVYKIIEKYRPDFIALGYDQRADISKLKTFLNSRGMKTKIVRIRSALNPGSYKSSKIKNLI
jgi:FAD synthetase